MSNLTVGRRFKKSVFIHRFTKLSRVYYETAALLTNGRWDVPKGGGSEGLEEGCSVNVGTKLSDLRGEAERGAGARPGEVLETVEGLDSWCQVRGRAFEDIPEAVYWRISVLDQCNGDTGVVAVKEDRIKEALRTQAKGAAVPGGFEGGTSGSIVFKSAVRIGMDRSRLMALACVRVTEGLPSGDLLISIVLTLKRGEVKRLVKTLTTVEARVRLNIGSFAPASDLAWWSANERAEDVWKPLIDDLVLVPRKEEGADAGASAQAGATEEEARSKGRKWKSRSSRRSDRAKKADIATAGTAPEAVPESLEFPERDGHETIELVSSAFALVRLVDIEESQEKEEEERHPSGGFLTKNPGVLSGGKVRVNGLTDLDHMDGVGGNEWGNDGEVDWDFMADNSGSSMSSTLSSTDKYKALIPGVTEVGKKEPLDWMARNLEATVELDKPRTQAVMQIWRDSEMSSTNAVQVTSLLASETPLTAPLCVYWELSESPTPSAPHETCDPWIPLNTVEGKSVAKDKLVSDLDSRTAPVIYLLNGSEQPPDFGGLEEIPPNMKYDSEKVLVGHDDLGFEVWQVRKRLKPEHRNRRRMGQLGKYGLRHNALVSKEIMRPIWQINPTIFGVTSKGATANKTGVTGRTIWHSKQRCIEVLCRQRTPFDHLYVIKAKSGSGFSDPRGHTLLMNGYHLDEMVGVGLGTFEKVYARIDARLQRDKKAQGLEAKIKQAEENLRKNRDQLQRELRMTSQKKVQRDAKFGGPEGKQPQAMSRESWVARREKSELLEERAGWEKREMLEGGHVFFFKNVAGIEGGEVEGRWDCPEDFEHHIESQMEEKEEEVGEGMGPGRAGAYEGETSQETKENEEKSKVRSERAERAQRSEAKRRFRVGEVDLAIRAGAGVLTLVAHLRSLLLCLPYSLLPLLRFRFDSWRSSSARTKHWLKPWP